MNFLSSILLFIAQSASSHISWMGLYQPEKPKKLDSK